MDKTRFRTIGCVILALMVLTLCGCGVMRQAKQSVKDAQAETDALLEQFMTCLEHNDVDGAAALAYDGDGLRKSFAALRETWPARGTDAYELKDLNVSLDVAGPEGSGTTVRAVYLVNSGGEEYQVILEKKHDANGDGIVTLSADRVQASAGDQEIPITGNGPVPGKTFGQWCFTGFWVLCCLFSLITIIDILRKKPRLYGLWIVIALVFLGFHIYFSRGSVQTGVHIGLLRSSEWIRYYGGANRFQLCLPFGTILYWCLRKNLLQKKVRYAVPADQPPPGQ